MRLGGLGFLNPVENAGSEYKALVNATAPLVNQIVAQAHEPDEADVSELRRRIRREKEEVLRRKCENFKM